MVPTALRAAVEELETIRRRVDLVELLVIQIARDSGATWEEIGEVLGISRQAARSRFALLRRRQRR